MRSKLRHGVFDGALADRQLTEQGALGHPEHRAVARQLVAQSAVLLENHNGLLPLDPTGLKVGLAGPFANNVGPLCGGWTVEWGGLVTPVSSVIGGTTIR